MGRGDEDVPAVHRHPVDRSHPGHDRHQHPAVGIGAIGSIIVGLLAFGETLNILGWAFLAVVVVGVLGLNMVTESDGE